MEECQHKTVKITAKKIANGSFHYVTQCQVCGEPTSNPIKKEIAYSMNDGKQPELFDFERQKKAREHRWEMLKIAKEIERKEFFGWYSEYLQTDKWKSKREKVLYRAQGLCEGCRDNPAEEVHHLNYENVGDEFLFQLVALCSECHKRYHEEKDARNQ